MSVNLSNDPKIDNVIPDNKWVFDSAVTNAFDDMLQKSIPDYNNMRNLIGLICDKFIDTDCHIIDIGASRGESIAKYADQDVNIKVVEISESMLEVLRDRFKTFSNVKIFDCDIRQDRSFIVQGESSIILSVLTLQFVPINYRQSIIFDIFNGLKEGGVFIFVEKVLGSSAIIDNLLVNCYHSIKHNNGYSYDDIERKKLALEGVLVPVTNDWNVQMLHSAGFRHVECFFRSLNFSGLLAIK